MIDINPPPSHLDTALEDLTEGLVQFVDFLESPDQVAEAIMKAFPAIDWGPSFPPWADSGREHYELVASLKEVVPDKGDVARAEYRAIARRRLADQSMLRTIRSARSRRALREVNPEEAEAGRELWEIPYLPHRIRTHAPESIRLLNTEGDQKAVLAFAGLFLLQWFPPMDDWGRLPQVMRVGMSFLEKEGPLW